MSTSNRSIPEFVRLEGSTQVALEFTPFKTSCSQRPFVPLKTAVATVAPSATKPDLYSEPNLDISAIGIAEPDRDKNSIQSQLNASILEVSKLQDEIKSIRKSHAEEIDTISKNMHDQISKNIIQSIEKEFSNLEINLNNIFSSIFVPFVKHEIENKIIAEFSEKISDLVTSSKTISLKIFGPQSLILKLENFSDKIGVLKLVPDESRAELVATIDDRVISTCFAEWKSLFEGDLP